MATIRNRITGFCAILAAMALVLPGEARAENEDRSNDADYAMNCAVEYAKVALADFNFLERQMALTERFELDHGNIGLVAMFGDVSDVVPIEWTVEGLAECDRTFGFSPITVAIGASPGIPQAIATPRIGDFDCAVAYRPLAAIRHDID